jgi:hypothetical protein
MDRPTFTQTAPTAITAVSDGSTIVTTITPGGDVVSSLVLVTSTQPNGEPTTLTSFQAPEATDNSGDNATLISIGTQIQPVIFTLGAGIILVLTFLGLV